MAENFSTIGINFDVFNNVSFDAFSSITNQSKIQFIESIPETANTLTDGYIGIVMLIIMGIWLVWMLTDISQFGLFRYSTIRGLGIALGIMAVFGINLVQIGFMTSFIHLTILTNLYLLILIYIIVSNPT